MTMQYKNFFSQQRILIVDDSSISRISIARALSELGATNAIISLAESFDAAQSLIASRAFTIVITEFDLGAYGGVDLINMLRRGSILALSAIVTKNQSAAAAAIAAENDVDLFIRKPFSMEDLKNAFGFAIQERMSPIGSSRADHDLDLAIEALQRSQDKKRIYDKAGYRALTQLFDSLMSEGNKIDAYLVLRRLVTTFPLYPDRLSMVLRLAIETRNFDDIETYYSLFLDVDSKEGELIRHVYAALVSSGKAALQNGQFESALKRFKWATLASGKKPAVLREIVLALSNGGYHAEADEFISAYPQHERQSIEFQTLDYFVMSKSQPIHLILQRGRELLKSGYMHSMIYEILIEACKSAGHHSEAESLAMDAGRRWPITDTSNVSLESESVTNLPPV